MNSNFKRWGVGIAALIATALAPGGSAAEPAVETPPAAPLERKLFDLDLAAFYREAAVQGAPTIMLPERQRNAFTAAEQPFAFTTPAWSQPGAFGHILDLPPVR